MWACVTISNRMWSLRPSWKVAIFLWNVPHRWRKMWAGCVCPVRNEYLLISAIVASAGLCVCYVSLQANGGRHRASLKGTQIDCLLAVSAPFWWSPKIKTSFFISGCKKAAKQSSMVFLPLHKYFSSASIQRHSLHTVQSKKMFGCLLTTLVLRMNIFAYLIIDSYLVTSSM